MYEKEMRRVRLALVLSAVLIAAGAFYLVFGGRLNIYDWRLGIVMLVVILGSFAVFAVNYQAHTRLSSAARCPVCGGLLDVSEISLRGKTTVGQETQPPITNLGRETLPPILDRIHKCTLCQREHHHVYAKWDEAGTTAPIHMGISFDQSIHSRTSMMQLRRPNMTDEEIKALYEKWDSFPRNPPVTQEEWETTLAELQQEAEARNIEAGMVFPEDKK